MQSVIKSIIILFFGIVSCKNSDRKINELGLDQRSTLLINSEYNTWIKEQYKLEKWEPNSMDIEAAHDLIEIAIKDNKFNFLAKPIKQNFKKYYRQYIPYINKNGDRIIEVNAFCKIPEYPVDGDIKSMDWEKKYVNIMDGGECYWQIKLNLDQMKYFDLNINSNA